MTAVLIWYILLGAAMCCSSTTIKDKEKAAREQPGGGLKGVCSNDALIPIVNAWGSNVKNLRLEGRFPWAQ